MVNRYLFILLFLLESCTAPFLSDSRGKILVVVSSENELPLKDGKKYSTGYYLNELIIPVMRLKDRGYELVFANPGANTPSMDIRSLSAKYFRSNEEYTKAKAFHENLHELRAPRSLRSVVDGGLRQYVGLLIPGGHAPMTDLMVHPEMGTILKHFHNYKKPTALICHGPVVLAATTENPEVFKRALINNNMKEAFAAVGDWPYLGYRMTVFSTPEEKVSEETLGGEPLFYPEQALKIPGGKVDLGKKWQAHVVRDRELITGQNPASDEELVEAFLSALEG